jgi:hypothetical protein
MPGTVVTFGDIFRHNEREYVFLAQVEDFIYAALILDPQSTAQFQRLSDTAEAKKMRARSSAAYSFVILETEAFAGRAAHLARTDGTDHQTLTFDIVGSLTTTDCNNIKSEIVSDTSCVPLRLVELIKALG